MTFLGSSVSLLRLFLGVRFWAYLNLLITNIPEYPFWALIQLGVQTHTVYTKKAQTRAVFANKIILLLNSLIGYKPYA